MFPQVEEAFWDWTNQVTLSLLKKQVNDFEVNETPVVDTTFQGMLQPMPPQKLLIKPEGQRSWKFFELWTQQYLKPDSVVMDEGGLTYRVMAKDDWIKGGFFHYELTQGVAGE